MRSFSFPRGGVVFQDTSAPPASISSIAFLPAISVVPLIQHQGGPAEAVVAPGDRVTEGMILARAQTPGSANVHSPVPGKILKRVSWAMADGRIVDAMVIRLEGAFGKLGHREERFPWEGVASHDLQRLIGEKGVVELEYPGRPVADIIRSALTGGETRTIVLRCVFDDPWFVADRTVCRERKDAVAEGLAIMLKASGAGKALVVLSKDDANLESPDMADRICASVERFGIQALRATVSSRYPQNDPRELTSVLRKYERREGLNLGNLYFISPGTAAAVYDAVKLNKPLIERHVAVGGGALKNPQVLRVRIGTRIGDVFAECGGFIEEPKRIGTGSPLLGIPVVDLDEPIVKTTRAVFALTESQIGETRVQDCMNCGECRTVCPVGLDPERLFKLHMARRDQEACIDRAADCYGCGCCEAVCPSRLPLSSAIQKSAIIGGSAC